MDIKLNLQFENSKYNDESLNKSIQSILEHNGLLSMASINQGQSWINAAYYCIDENLNFYILSDPATEHAMNLKHNDSVALAIFDSCQKWDDDKKGLQIFGRCHKAKLSELPTAIRLYTERFASFGQFIKHPGDFAKSALTSRFYKIETDSIKLFDETNFGEEEFIKLIPQK